MTTTPPGWYDDGHGAMRWWDGSQWTEHVAAPDAETTDAPTEAEIVAASEAVPSPVAADHQASSGADPAAALFHLRGADQAQGAPATPDPADRQPGADASGGAFAAATGGRKNKLWILWLVLGMVLLGIVIAAAVLIPLFVLNGASGGSGGDGGATSADEQAAVAAVELYDEAWQNADCDAFNTATTEKFRADSQFADCASFETEAQAFDTNFDEYEVAIDEIATDGDVITVTTTESYLALVDDAGNPIEAPEGGSTMYHYTLVPAGDGGWAIDGLTYE